MNPTLISLIGCGVVAIGAYFYGLNTGEKIERLKWETANVETLTGSNKILKEHIEGIEAQIPKEQERDNEIGQRVQTQTERVIERIISVPVERVVEIRVPADCDVDDVDISYDTLRLLNAWSKGERLGEQPAATATRNIPLVGAAKVPGDTSGD